MKHDDVWRALDTLAAESGLSTADLAKRAGLDPTTLNRRTRFRRDGRERWPNTESVAKVLQATGVSLEAFAALANGARALSSGKAGRAIGRRIPLIDLAQAGGEGLFDDGGYPVGGGWDEVRVPEIAAPAAYALTIRDATMEPVFRRGDLLIVSPAAPVRRGDRVVVRTAKGEVMAKQLARRSAQQITLRSLNPMHVDLSLNRTELAWMHRIVWASQ